MLENMKIIEKVYISQHLLTWFPPKIKTLELLNPFCLLLCAHAATLWVVGPARRWMRKKSWSSCFKGSIRASRTHSCSGVSRLCIPSTRRTIWMVNDVEKKKKVFCLVLEAKVPFVLHLCPYQFPRLHPSWRKWNLHMRCMTMSGPTLETPSRPRTLPSSSWSAVPNRTLTNRNRHRTNSRPSSSSRWANPNKLYFLIKLADNYWPSFFFYFSKDSVWGGTSSLFQSNHTADQQQRFETVTSGKKKKKQKMVRADPSILGETEIFENNLHTNLLL